MNGIASIDERGATALRQADDPVALPAAWDAASSVPAASLALWVILVSVTMLFAGFVSAYLIRRTALDWTPIFSPPILAHNTLLILASSVALQFARRERSSNRLGGFRSWLIIGLALGGLFIVGQIVAWRQLGAAGVFLPSSPHGSFFFMLTAVHAVHVLGGLAALVYALRKTWNLPSIVTKTTAADGVALSSTYWHFVAGIWIFLYLLLFVWR